MASRTLDQFRPDNTVSPAARKAAKRRPEWTAPTRADLGQGCILAFDPSLGATGFVALEHTQGLLRVVDAQTIKGDAPEMCTGWERVFQQALTLGAKLRSLLEPYSRLSWSVVHESPPVGGGKIKSIESTVLAGQSLRFATECLGFAMMPMVSSVQHKYATVGRSHLDKPTHHQLLKPILEALALDNLSYITNEAKRDAISVALTELMRRKS